MKPNNFTSSEKWTETEDLLCLTPIFADGTVKYLKGFSVLNILLSITAFLGNTLILVAMRRESIYLHRPSKLLFRCLATTDLCVGLIAQPVVVVFLLSLVFKRSNLCRLAISASSVVNYLLCSVSLMTMTAISLDRLLSLILRMRYRQIVTLKRASFVVVNIWVMAIVAASMYLVNPRITVWYGRIGIPMCLTLSFASYTKIFHTLRRRVQVQDHSQQEQQLNHVSPLNTARYRKAVYSSLWVQVVLVVCYLPHHIVITFSTYSRLSSSQLLAWSITGLLVYLNSSLNPLLYCWKITEVRQAVKEIIRGSLLCPWN